MLQIFPQLSPDVPSVKIIQVPHCHSHTGFSTAALKPEPMFFVPLLNPVPHFPEPCRGFSLSNRLTSCADSKLQEKGFHAWLQLVVVETLSNVSSKDLSELCLVLWPLKIKRAPQCPIWGNKSIFLPILHMQEIYTTYNSQKGFCRTWQRVRSTKKENLNLALPLKFLCQPCIDDILSGHSSQQLNGKQLY